MVRMSSSGAEPYVEGRKSLRGRYCVALSVVTALLLVLFAPALTDAAGRALDFVWAHYEWAVLPLVAVVLAFATYQYLMLGSFFGDVSDAPLYVSMMGGVVLAALVTVGWSAPGVYSEQLIGGLTGWDLAIALGVAVGVALLLRLINFDLVAGWPLVVFAVVVAGPAVYVTGRALLSGPSWSSVWADAGHFFANIWALALVPVAAVAQLVLWRRRRRTSETAPSALFGRGRAATVDLVGAGLVLGLLAFAVLYEVPELLIAHDGLSNSQFVDAITQERRTLLAVMGAAGAGITLVYTHLRHQLDRDANATGRYTEAVQQLGSASMSIRLGGIYALARVARDSPSDAQTVTEVLAAFVRDGTRAMSSGGVDLDVMAALSELGGTSRRDNDFAEVVNLRSSNLCEGNFDGVRFPSPVDLSHSDLTNAVLTGVRMERADLSDSKLIGASLNQASLEQLRLEDAEAFGANFRDAYVGWGYLSRADLENCDFTGAHLMGAVLVGANLRGATLRDADLEGADLRDANLERVDLTGADLSGALLHGATGLTSSMLASARDISGLVLEELSYEMTRDYQEWRRDRAPDDDFYDPDDVIRRDRRA
jgi:uncharacterized protein YjbI with pentapeptide repeats